MLLLTLPLQVGAQKVITFESTSGHVRDNENHFAAAENSVTTGLFSPFGGLLPLYYERRLTDFLSIQAGAGLTFRSLMHDLGEGIREDGGNVDFAATDGYDVPDKYNNYTYRRANMGMYLSISPRIYFEDDCMDGFYLSPSLEWRTHRFSAKLANPAITLAESGADIYEDSDSDIPRIDDVMKEKVTYMDMMIRIGKHTQPKKNLVIGWSLAAGLRQGKLSRLDVYVEDDGNGNQYFRNREHNYEKMRLMVNVNMTIGGCF